MDLIRLNLCYTHIMSNKRFLVVIGVLYLLAFILGLPNTLNGNFSGISWFFTPLGILIWGDALIIGPFIALGCLWLWYKNNFSWTGLFFSAYYGARSFFEIVYCMVGQCFPLDPNNRPWEVPWRGFGMVQRGIFKV